LSRRDRILKYADLSGQGIEIAPYFNPIAPKRDGHNVLIMDVFDTARLHENALGDPQIPNERVTEIEPVDIVGDASEIGQIVFGLGLSGKISFIISSHNFEHLPNPILFLQGCYEALEPGGFLSMAVPDCRACFDHFRTPTRLVNWLEPFHDRRTAPSAAEIFDYHTTKAMYHSGTKTRSGTKFPFGDPKNFIPERNLRNSYEKYQERLSSSYDYVDTHCSVFFPETLQLMLLELNWLGLMRLEVVEITETRGVEFFVHLRKPDSKSVMTEDQFYARRHDLLVNISRQLGSAPYHKFWMSKIVNLARTVIGN